MGIRGRVQVKNPEYGKCCVSSWIYEQSIRLMRDNGITIYEHNGDFDQWEIEITKSLEDFVESLKKNPDIIDEYISEDMKSNEYGNGLLSVLNEGLDAAKKENMDYLIIDWF